jgi:hypothetical protein
MSVALIFDNTTQSLRALTTQDITSGGGGSVSDPSFVTLSSGGSAVGSTNPLYVEVLGIPSVARQLAVTNASATATLTATCRRVSIRARGTDIRYVIGTGSPVANASTSHFLAQDERLDVAVPPNCVIAGIRESASSSNGSLEITELI